MFLFLFFIFVFFQEKISLCPQTWNWTCDYHLPPSSSCIKDMFSMLGFLSDFNAVLQMCSGITDVFCVLGFMSGFNWEILTLLICLLFWPWQSYLS